MGGLVSLPRSRATVLAEFLESPLTARVSEKRMADRIRMLEAELSRESARLDWLNSGAKLSVVGAYVSRGQSTRGIIDLAMAGEMPAARRDL